MKDIREGGVYTAIPGYPLYEIDHAGDVRRIFKSKHRSLKPSIRQGKYTVRLYAPDGTRKEEFVHKLMQRTFLGAGPPGHVLYHKNGNLQDNYVNNFRFITRSDLGKIAGAKSRRKPVAKINANGETVEVYSSARKAAKANFMSYQTVMDRCNGKIKNPFALDGHRYAWDEDLI